MTFSEMLNVLSKVFVRNAIGTLRQPRNRFLEGQGAWQRGIYKKYLAFRPVDHYLVTGIVLRQDHTEIGQCFLFRYVNDAHSGIIPLGYS